MSEIFLVFKQNDLFMRENLGAYTHLEDAIGRANSEASAFEQKMEAKEAIRAENTGSERFPYRVACLDFTDEAGRLQDSFVVERIALDAPFIEFVGWEDCGNTT